jgi:hypothetical protein
LPALKSKRIVEPLSKTGVYVEKIYCRKCMEVKHPNSFYTATDLYLDSNGYMSICKECVDKIFDKMLITESTLERALLRVCRILNVRYDEKAIRALIEDIKTREKNNQEMKGLFGQYKAKLGFTGLRTEKLINTEDIGDLTFIEPSSDEVKKILDIQMEEKEYFVESWGQGMTPDDYSFLEKEFAKWKRTTKCDTQAEEVLVRELCHKQNEIRKARIEAKSVDGLVKSMQEIMKNSALTPALQNAASAGKNMDTFGAWIKEIETLEPAEWYEDQIKYKDIDGIGKDIEDIKRSIGNFITGSRDFNTTDLEEVNELDELETKLEQDGE